MQRRITVSAKKQNLVVIRDFIEQQIGVLGLDSQTVYDVILAVDEIATNIITHGYQGNPGEIRVEVLLHPPDLAIQLVDQAPHFDPRLAQTPNIDLPLEKRPIGGLGIFLARELMDEIVHYTPPQGGNQVTMIKRGVLTPNQQLDS